MDAGTKDIGYVRSVQRPDGKVVSVYYYSTAQNKERDIIATIWDPDYAPPHILQAKPQAQVINQKQEAILQVLTDVPAICRYALKPGVPFSQMEQSFTKTGHKLHKTKIYNLIDGREYIFYVKAASPDGSQAMAFDYEIRFKYINRKFKRTKKFFSCHDFTISPPLKVYHSHGKQTAPCYMSLKEAKGTKFEINDPQKGQAIVEFELKYPGRYLIWAYAYGASPNEDSFWITVDNEKPAHFSVNAHSAHKEWHWLPVNDCSIKEKKHWYEPNNVGPPRWVYELKAGMHRLTISPREANARISKIIITNDFSFNISDELPR
jgi:hypothetical protein